MRANELALGGQIHPCCLQEGRCLSKCRRGGPLLSPQAQLGLPSNVLPSASVLIRYYLRAKNLLLHSRNSVIAGTKWLR